MGAKNSGSALASPVQQADRPGALSYCTQHHLMTKRLAQSNKRSRYYEGGKNNLPRHRSSDCALQYVGFIFQMQSANQRAEA
ncbi:hypothetical protein E4U54_004297 [Claviceps lovelessii]|nr:hypothetical protein E4U54_004297 [Claviceps lovelessii]